MTLVLAGVVTVSTRPAIASTSAFGRRRTGCVLRPASPADPILSYMVAIPMCAGLICVNALTGTHKNHEGLIVGKIENDTSAPETVEPVFQHVDRYGRVSLLPLRTETQRLFVVASRPNPNGHQDATQEAARSLTAREWQVFDLLIAGLSNKLIAHELQISPRTVEIHRAHLMRKMGVRTTAALVRTALAA